MEEEEIEKSRITAQIHANTNITLVFISFTVFAFVITVNSQILKDDYLLALQLTLAIPFLISSLFARAKLAISKMNIKRFDNFGYICYVIGYTFLINSMGILLADFVAVTVSMIFFMVNIAMALIYSLILTLTKGSKVKSRLAKDLFFILLILAGGLLPSLGYY